MPDIYLHNKKLESIFELLGSKENDITYSVGWALSQCPCFLDALIRDLFREGIDVRFAAVHLQHHDDQYGGFTDIEIMSDDIHIIVEAKRGWNLPSAGQLSGYQPRFSGPAVKHKAFLVIAECSKHYVDEYFHTKDIAEIPIHYRTWKAVGKLAEVGQSHEEKRLLRQLRTYIRRFTGMQKQTSNLVYCVALNDTGIGGGLTYIDVVKKRRRYFHPYGTEKSWGGQWPKEPPNYFGFRHGGALLSIHHVEDFSLTHNLHDYFPECPDEKRDKPLVIYRLGDAIIPPRRLSTGKKIFGSAHHEVMLDALLTCDTFAAALRVTNERIQKSE